MKRLVLVGGGHAHIEVMRRFGLAPLPDVEITLISPDRHTAYSGMLPGLIAGHYGWRASHIDLEVLARNTRVRLLRDIAIGLDYQCKVVRCADAVEVPYDIVSLDVGSVPDTRVISGADHFGLPIRPVQRFLAAWDGMIHEADEQRLDIAIVGAGAGGVELCLSMEYRLRKRMPRFGAQFTLITESAQILPDHAARVRGRFEKIVSARGVMVKTKSRVTGVDEQGLRLNEGERLTAGRVVWVTGPAPPRWLRDSGLRTDDAGFVLIGDQLQSLSNADVFAVGDIATNVNSPRPKSGVFAVRQGPPLAENLRLALKGQSPRSHEPQALALQLIGTGDHYAVASWGAVSAEGAWVWRWKDWIDRRFVRRYRMV